ncbi:restriction endonuclease subunit S [Ancylobacter sp. TS-1]|uniref:restriction endonuclease subunit S n=1 Tax=Ancylobacter sp. TS-1 TaxID=1850374 RepID=UPI001265B1B7|nr:restriction endonuclease subunit S [Ancylobacter sp. TS-1]QFR33824.1 restriction endonuclease subunit S [Ancylobacter sp. TS-1]
MNAALKPYPQYRDSGVDWLPTVPAHWDFVRNGRLFAERNETGFPDLPILEVSLRTGVRVRDMEGGRKQQMADRAKYKRAAKGDIAYNIMRMWQGSVGIAPCDGLISPAYVVAQPLDDIEPRFYTYLFRITAYMREVDFASRGIVPDRNRLYWQYFKPLLSPAPPSEEQRRIADFLDAYTAQVHRLIAAKRRTIAALIERKQAILTGLLRSGLDGATIITGDLPWIDQRPGDWRVNRLKPFVRNITALGTVSEPSESIITLDRVESWSGRVLDGSPVTSDTFTGKLFEKDDVLFGKLRPYLAKVMRTNEVGLAGTEFLVLRSKPDIFRPIFLELLLRSKPFIDYVASHSVGAKMPRTEWEAIAAIPVAIPSLMQQDRLCEHFAAASGDLDEAIAKERSQIDLILEYRDSLIAAVVTGRLDVRDAVIPVVESDGLADDTATDGEDMEDALDAVD